MVFKEQLFKHLIRLKTAGEKPTQNKNWKTVQSA